jgi:hypothetical protein
MITNESDIRIAVQAMLVCALALWGFWTCAAVMLILMVPWSPFFAVTGYLAKPIVDWRHRKARAGHKKGVAHIEKELGTLLSKSKDRGRIPARAALPKTQVAAKAPKPESSQSLQASQSDIPNATPLQDLTASAQNLLVPLAIPSAIADYVRDLPQGDLSNTNMEVEQVKFVEDTAEADVKFQSPHMKEAIRQRYTLRKSGGQWKVESQQPPNGGSKVPRHSLPALAGPKKARSIPAEG